MPPYIFKLQESWSKVDYVGRGIVVVLSTTFFSNSSWSNDQGPPPLMESALAHL